MDTVRRRWRAGWAGVTFVATLCSAAPLSAQTCTTDNTPAYPKTCVLDNTLVWTVPALLRLTLRTGATPLALTTADFVTGSRIAAGPTIAVQRNRPFSLTVQSLGANWVASGGGNPAAPVSSLAWGLRGGGPWTPLTTAPAPLFASAVGRAGLAPPVLWYRVTVGGVFWPGSYATTLRLTVRAP
jgi:hypothetical protein